MISGIGSFKKTFAFIGIMAILLPNIFIFSAKKAEATVATIDAGTLAQVTETVSTLYEVWNTVTKVYKEATKLLNSLLTIEKKEYWYDTILYAIVKALLRQLTNGIVEWIRSGFENPDGSTSPLFIQDFGKTLTDAADQATGMMLKKLLSPEIFNALCTPFGLQLQLALGRKDSLADRMQCTLRTIIGNFSTAQDFANGLRGANSDAAWFAAALNPQSEPLGALTVASEQLALAKIAGIETAKTESIFNQGFLSVKKCAPGPENQFCDDWTGKCTCINYITTSPGKWVSDTLHDATGADIQTLIAADEIDEMITAILSALLSWALSGDAGDEGIAYAPLPPVVPVACSPRLFEEVNTSISKEAAYRDTLRLAVSAINDAKTNYEGAKKCFFNAGLNESDPVIAEINAEIEIIKEMIIDLQKDFSDAVDVINQLENLRSRWPSAANCQAEIEAIMAEYYALKERLHTSLVAAENALFEAQRKLNDSIRIYTLACNQPPPPVSTTGIRANGRAGQITIFYKDEAFITWCGAPATPCVGATSCTVNAPGVNWTGTSGTYRTGSLIKIMTYTLNCQGTPPIIDSVTVNVESPW